MIFTNSSGNIQPYISWKGKSTYTVTPKWTPPISSLNTTPNAPDFKPRPIKHWRKQLHTRNKTGFSRSSVSIQSDRPGAGTYVGVNNNCNCNNSKDSNFLIVNIPNTKNNPIYKTDYVVGVNKSRVCINCSKPNNIIKSARTEKLINPVNSTSEPKQKYHFNTNSYLKSKCSLYNQRLSGMRVEGNVYIIPGTNTPSQPSDSILGSQVRNTLDCSSKCNNKPVKIIYKPNNPQFSTQGAVSSSTRLQKLKVDTVNKNGANLSSAWGAAASNAGKYSSNSVAPYFIKSKNNICNKSLYHKNGNKTTC
jgi:hypothetical protein